MNNEYKKYGRYFDTHDTRFILEKTDYSDVEDCCYIGIIVDYNCYLDLRGTIKIKVTYITLQKFKSTLYFV